MKSFSIIVLLLSLLPGISRSSPTCVFDDFENDNSVCWEKADNRWNGLPFWNGWRADHIEFTSGIMRLRLDDQPCVTDLATCSNQPYASGEYRSRELYRYGRFETRLKAVKQSGVVTAFFIYNDNPHDEIDIEILGLDPTQMQVNYFTNGVGGHEKIIPLGFDASAAFHTYAIEWLPNMIRWYVDDQLVHTEVDSQGNLPTTPGKVMMNFWPVTVDVEQWAGRFIYSSPIDAQYDWFKYLPLVKLTLTTNKVIFSPGDTLSLSGAIMPTTDATVQSDIYIAAVLPDDKEVFSLDPNFTWKAGWVPILPAFTLTELQATDFYSLLLPAGLPLGKYTFSLVAVPTGADPLNSTTWLNSTSTEVFLTPPLTVSSAFPQFSKARTQPYINKAATASLNGGKCKDPECLHQNSYALKLDYTMPSGNWGSYNLDLSNFDVGKATYLTLWTKGAVGGERLGVVLWSDCTAGFPGRPNSALISVEPNWQQHQILLADFQPYVDLSSLCRLSIDFNDAIHPQGTIYLDGIAFTDAQGKLIYTPDEVSLATYNSILAMIEPITGLPHDRFSALLFDILPQFATLRVLPQTATASGARLEKVYCTDPSCRYSGKYGLKLTYTMPPGTWGTYNIEPARFNVKQAKYLELWTKGEQGNERFEVVLWSDCAGDFPGRPESALISVSPSWTRQRIPLADFQPYVDLGNLCRLNIGFNDAIHPGGTIYFDQIAVVDAEGNRVPIALDEDTNVSNIGLYLADLIGALELGWQDDEDVFARLEQTLTSIEALPKLHGFPHTHNHVVSLTPKKTFNPSDRCREPNTPPLEEPNLFSTVDLSNLAAGLILVRQRIPELAERATALLDAMEWDWLYDSQLELLYGCRAHDGNPSTWWHYDWLAADARLAYFIGIGKGDIPPQAWQKLNRSWEEPKCADVWHLEPGWEGGGLFMAFLPGIFIDEAENEIGISACNFARDQICEAKKIGAPAWGWSATVLPSHGEKYCGYGCENLDVIVPHASILAAECVTPKQLSQNLLALEALDAREWVTDGEQWFDFGFRASVDWKQAQNQEPAAVATTYLFLDQSMAFLSLVNEITNGRLRELFHQDEIVKLATAKIADYVKCNGELTLYTSSNLAGHTVVAECNPGGTTNCPCSDADVSITSLADEGIVTSNSHENNTWVNAIGYKKFTEQLPNNQPISLGTYQYQGQFRLPQIPTQDITQDNPEAMHLMIQLWDGRNQLLQVNKQTLEGALYWELNPWHDDYRKLKVYISEPTNSPPLALVDTGISLEPDTNWHTFALVVDLAKQEYRSVTIDGETKALNGIELARVPQDWGEDVFLSITTESQASWPQEDCSHIFQWPTHFRNLEFSCLPSCSIVNMDNPPSRPISSPFQVTWEPPEDMVLQIYQDGHLIYDEKRPAGTSFTLSPGRFEVKVWNRGEEPYTSVWIDVIETSSSCSQEAVIPLLARQ